MNQNFASTYSMIDLGQFAAALAGPARSAAQRDVVLDAVCARLPNRWVSLPAREYRQLLDLLATHAMQTCRSGRATMVLDQTPVDATRVQCRIRVIDAKEGLSHQDRLQLGERLTTAPVLVRELPADLLPAAALARAIGGELVLGQGPQGTTVLTLEFTCHAAAHAAATSPASHAVRPTPAQAQREFRKLLLVDDNAINQLVVAEQLTRMGFEVATASDGVDALDILEAESFDFVLCDCDMPGMNGFEFTRTVRAREAGADTHLIIVALTVDHSDQSRRECLACGMDGWLTKPIEPHKLQEVFEHLRRV